MDRDSLNDFKKCSMEASKRTFKLKGTDAKEAKCIEKCSEDINCIAMSGIWGEFCIGCKEILSTPQPGTIAFIRRTNICLLHLSNI